MRVFGFVVFRGVGKYYRLDRTPLNSPLDSLSRKAVQSLLVTVYESFVKEIALQFGGIITVHDKIEHQSNTPGRSLVINHF